MRGTTKPKPNQWLVQEYKARDPKRDSDVFDVLCNRRSFAYDLDSLETAVNRITRARKYTPEDRIVFSDWRGHRSVVKPKTFRASSL